MIHTSEGRFNVRRQRWRSSERRLADAQHFAWWWAHNCVAHPLLGIWPSALTVRLHDVTAKELNLFPELYSSPMPIIERRGWWLVHNVVGHLLIGLLPCRLTFRWQDAAAKAMRVPNWV